MAIGKIKTTFEVISPESSVNGETEDSGWEDEEGIEFDCVADAVEFLVDKGVEQGNSRDYYSVDPDRNYQTGEETYYGYHLDGFNDKHMKEINDLFTQCDMSDIKFCRQLLQVKRDECEVD